MSDESKEKEKDEETRLIEAGFKQLGLAPPLLNDTHLKHSSKGKNNDDSLVDTGISSSEESTSNEIKRPSKLNKSKNKSDGNEGDADEKVDKVKSMPGNGSSVLTNSNNGTKKLKPSAFEELDFYEKRQNKTSNLTLPSSSSESGRYKLRQSSPDRDKDQDEYEKNKQEQHDMPSKFEKKPNKIVKLELSNGEGSETIESVKSDEQKDTDTARDKQEGEKQLTHDESQTHANLLKEDGATTSHKEGSNASTNKLNSDNDTTKGSEKQSQHHSELIHIAPMKEAYDKDRKLQPYVNPMKETAEAPHKEKNNSRHEHSPVNKWDLIENSLKRIKEYGDNIKHNSKVKTNDDENSELEINPNTSSHLTSTSHLKKALDILEKNLDKFPLTKHLLNQNNKYHLSSILNDKKLLNSIDNLKLKKLALEKVRHDKLIDLSNEVNQINKVDLSKDESGAHSNNSNNKLNKTKVNESLKLTEKEEKLDDQPLDTTESHPKPVQDTLQDSPGNTDTVKIDETTDSDGKQEKEKSHDSSEKVKEIEKESSEDTMDNEINKENGKTESQLGNIADNVNNVMENAPTAINSSDKPSFFP